MSRPERFNVDYFPHECTHGRKMFVVQQKYGNDGYAAWFKIIEELGLANNHFLDLRDSTQRMYLASKLLITEEKMIEIISTIAELNGIESDLWFQNKVIFSQKFIESISDAYERRNNKCMNLLSLCEHLSIKCIQKPISKEINYDIYPQRIGKDIKSNKTKEKNNSVVFKKPTVSDIKDFCNERKNSVDDEHFWNYYESNGWMVGKKKMVKWKSCVITWEKNSFQKNQSNSHFVNLSEIINGK